MEDIKGYKVFYIPSKKIIKVKKDFLNGELLFSNGNIGRDDDIIIMEELNLYIQTHQELINEFNSLLEDDKDFNYNKNEFINWFFDYYYI